MFFDSIKEKKFLIALRFTWYDPIQNLVYTDFSGQPLLMLTLKRY